MGEVELFSDAGASDFNGSDTAAGKGGYFLGRHVEPKESAETTFRGAQIGAYFVEFLIKVPFYL